MQYRIAVDPKIGLSADQFVEAWNSSQYKEDTSAVVTDASGLTFLSSEFTVALISAAVSIPTAVIANFISEYIKKIFSEKDSPKISVTSINTPDGQPLLIVKQSEE